MKNENSYINWIKKDPTVIYLLDNLHKYTNLFYKYFIILISIILILISIHIYILFKCMNYLKMVNKNMVFNKII